MEKNELSEFNSKLNGDFKEADKEWNETSVDRKESTVMIDESPPKFLIYGIKDSPPIHITIICGLQVCYLKLRPWDFNVRIQADLASIYLRYGLCTPVKIK